MEKKNFANLRLLFATNPAGTNWVDLRTLKQFIEENLKELSGWESSQKLNGDYAIEGWINFLQKLLEDINEELKRRWMLIENPKSTYEELKSLFETSPEALPEDDLYLFKYMLENQAAVIGNIQSEGIPQHCITAFHKSAETLIEKIDSELERRGN